MFPSTYITYSLLPGDPTPLPAWPMRVACSDSGLNEDLGITVTGNKTDVKFTARLGAISVDVDWGNATGNGATLTAAEIEASGVLKLATAVADAAGVWYNLTKDVPCFKIGAADGGGAPIVSTSTSTSATPLSSTASSTTDRVGEAFNRSLTRALLESSSSTRSTTSSSTTTSSTSSNSSSMMGEGPSCPTCPPCDDCPPCPVSYCDWEDTAPCDHPTELSKTFSWEGICCNEALSQIDIKGVGRDIFWPPQVPTRDYTVESIVGPRHLGAGGCSAQYVSLTAYSLLSC